ncbi:hypothetical protein ACFLIN_09840 [Corynebacterium kutscheri]|nr:hypothetical protein [Corynebacterium kutscheri]
MPTNKTTIIMPCTKPIIPIPIPIPIPDPHNPTPSPNAMSMVVVPPTETNKPESSALQARLANTGMSLEGLLISAMVLSIIGLVSVLRSIKKDI